MPNKNYQRGVRYERKIQSDIGMNSIRTAGSHGVFDVIAYNKDVVRFIQCKASKKKDIRLSDYWSDIEAIAEEQVPDTSTKELWVYYGRGKLHKVWVV